MAKVSGASEIGVNTPPIEANISQSPYPTIILLHKSLGIRTGEISGLVRDGCNRFDLDLIVWLYKACDLNQRAGRQRITEITKPDFVDVHQLIEFCYVNSHSDYITEAPSLGFQNAFEPIHDHSCLL